MTVTLGHEATVDRLEAVDQLRDCTRAQLEEVARLAERVQVGEGEVLAREGRIGREFFLILSGDVAVTRDGRRINSLGPGHFFGELAVMNQVPRNATVTALSEVDVLIIGPREFAAMAEIPGFRDALFKSMANRLGEVDEQIAEAIDQQERAAADTNDKRESACQRGPEGSVSGDHAASHNLRPRSYRRWG